MAKQQIKRSRQLEVCGTLDIDDDKFIVTVGDTFYLLEDLLADMLGTELTLKCVDEIK